MGRYSYKKALDSLSSYAESEGFGKISFDGEISFISWKPKTLYSPDKLNIEANETWENKVYFMLHELGHHELRKNWNRFTLRFPVVAYAEKVNIDMKERKYMRRDSYIVSSLQEEFTAWDEGHKLGLKLGIKIQEPKWVALKSKCLKGYITYFANLNK